MSPCKLLGQKTRKNDRIARIGRETSDYPLNDILHKDTIHYLLTLLHIATSYDSLGTYGKLADYSTNSLASKR